MTHSTPALIALARQKASKYGLDGDLVCAVCEQESQWDPWAIRYEPGFFKEYEATMNVGISEKIARATSWGLMQVMGQTAREFGFKDAFLSLLCDPECGMEFGCKKLSACMGKTDNNVDAALLRYNGGANPAYSEQVRDRLKTYNS